MQTRMLGTSDLEVSVLGLGAMFFGTRTDQDLSFQLLDAYVDAGGNFIDTANIYAHWVEGFRGGESETLLGEWLRTRKNRYKVFIASKVGFDYPGVTRELSAKSIKQECEKSLKRMGIDTFDLYYAHVDDYKTPLEETVATFDNLVKAGKARYIGASNYLAWRLEQALGLSKVNGWAPFCCVQQRHTYLRVKPSGDASPQVASNPDLFDFAVNRQFPIVAYSVLLGGAYSKPDRLIPSAYIGPDTDCRLAMLKTIATETGATINQVIIAWMLQSDYPVIPLIAASDHAQLKENLGALDRHLSADQMHRLDSASA